MDTNQPPVENQPILPPRSSDKTLIVGVAVVVVIILAVSMGMYVANSQPGKRDVGAYGRSPTRALQPLASNTPVPNAQSSEEMGELESILIEDLEREFSSLESELKNL